MPITPVRRQLLIAALIGLATLALCLIMPRPGYTNAPVGMQALEKGHYDPKTTKYTGALNCAGCHKEPLDVYKNRLGYLQLTEYTTWLNHDKHSFAYESLKTDRAKKMEQLLKTDFQGKIVETDVTKDDRCLNCHSINLKQDDVRRRPTFLLTDGVNCEGCHGPAGEWLEPHSDFLTWRYAPPEIKATYGMQDIRNPVVRAQVCNSCHIGNIEKGRFVTHEMYAAGHPPLPSIELATFSHYLPNHWYLFKDKSEEVKEELKKRFQVDTDALEHSKLVVIGGVAGLRDAMNLLASEAEGLQEHGDDPTKRALDFAQFDCYACHHDLKQESWRQAQMRVGAPGRLPMRRWPTVLAEVGRRLAGRPSGELEKHVAQLRSYFEARPFGYGKAKEIASAARNVAQETELLLMDLDKVRFDQATARRLLRELCTVAKARTLDYDSARQVAWAIRMIYAEDLHPQPANDREICEIIDRLTSQLKLDLPSGHQKEIEKELPQALKTASDYQAADFQRDIEELARRLPGD